MKHPVSDEKKHDVKQDTSRHRSGSLHSQLERANRINRCWKDVSVQAAGTGIVLGMHSSHAAMIEAEQKQQPMQ